MSWLTEYDITYNYKCKQGHLTQVVLPSKEDAPKIYRCGSCYAMGQYQGFEPNAVDQVTKIEYEQNGRKAVCIKSKGKIQYISKTKLNYVKTGKIESQYTKGYTEHLQKTQQDQLLKSDRGKHGKGKASLAKTKEAFKRMPEGEYLSDGKSFLPVPQGTGDTKK